MNKNRLSLIFTGLECVCVLAILVLIFLFLFNQEGEKSLILLLLLFVYFDLKNRIFTAKTPLRQTEQVIHLKTGNIYTIVEKEAICATNKHEGAILVVYFKDDKLFVRDKKEFWEKFKRV